MKFMAVWNSIVPQVRPGLYINLPILILGYITCIPPERILISMHEDWMIVGNGGCLGIAITVYWLLWTGYLSLLSNWLISLVRISLYQYLPPMSWWDFSFDCLWIIWINAAAHDWFCFRSIMVMVLHDCMKVTFESGKHAERKASWLDQAMSSNLKKNTRILVLQKSRQFWFVHASNLIKTKSPKLLNIKIE
jgi:hypothetical protein